MRRVVLLTWFYLLTTTTSGEVCRVDAPTLAACDTQRQADLRATAGVSVQPPARQPLATRCTEGPWPAGQPECWTDRMVLPKLAHQTTGHR